MKKLRWLESVRKERPSFLPSWQRSPGDVIISNERFAKMLHVVACDEHGVPSYDQPVWVERGGAVVVGVDERGRIAVIEHQRSAPVAPEFEDQGEIELSHHGRVSFEFPRGFAEPGESPLETALREAEEETGLAARDPEFIGETNQNTTYFLFNTPIVRVRLGDRASLRAADANESIKQPSSRTSILKAPAEIAAMISTGQIICGLTKAAFVTHLAASLTDLLREDSR